MQATKQELAIIDYLRTISHNVVNLSPKHASVIIELCNNPKLLELGTIKMWQYNASAKRYDFLRLLKLPQEAINEALQLALNKRPVEQFIMYELYNHHNELEGKIYTDNASLFD